MALPIIVVGDMTSHGGRVISGSDIHTIGGKAIARLHDLDLPDFFGPFQSWRTASVASVEQYRCLNSSGVR
ncbi:hypothetical protein BW685_25365 [Burkholderia ubonensis]|uniref:Uncharacterized protein n=1 Tax=Burkholderia ubonensis TaxID=101571 RepID=A0A1R1J5K9_9BURK|nr:hypothetical protein BW685_25460 [Burkholderia ubonensis]OMG70624.1 hypothetical protein BW685_25365 [Burkholderia ubonensis]